MKAVSLVIVLTFLSLPAMAAPPKPVITGGWQSTKIDKDVRAAADAALRGLKAKATILIINDAQSQIVAGINYRMTLTLSDKSRWDVKVWKKLDGKMVLTEARLILPKPSTEERLGGMGTVIDVVDGGYPFFTVTIHFGAGKPIEMLAQAEDLGVGGELANFKGKRVTAAYVVKDEPDLMEMQLSGRSLMGEAAPKKADPSWRKITGVLSGAAEVTGGDLPDDITVTPGNGPKMTFEYYVDEAMTKGEGKTVTAWYGLRRMTRLTQIKLR